jgi:hypothetical protein
MKLKIEEGDNMIYYYIEDNKFHKCLGLNVPLHLEIIKDTIRRRTVAIIYPKGNRPNLPYPVNKLNEEK